MANQTEQKNQASEFEWWESIAEVFFTLILRRSESQYWRQVRTGFPWEIRRSNGKRVSLSGGSYYLRYFLRKYEGGV